MIASLRRYDSSEVAEKRLAILNFYGSHGEKATKQAFGVGRKTLHVWKERLILSKGKIQSLIPFSTKPISPRGMETNPKVVEYIRLLREKHPKLGKEKIEPVLAEYCRLNNLPCISISTIGKLIKRNNLFYQKQGRLYHNPASLFAKNKAKVRRLRIRYSPKHEELGHLQMDTVLKFADGVKYYFYCAIDTKGKFSLSLPYQSLNSKNTLDFFIKLTLVVPFKILSVQTDNGLEFLGVFDEYLKKQAIPHFFIYPRCPRINGVVERFNRSIQEEFIDPNLHLIHDAKLFSSKLVDYLLFYNCVRVHKALGNITPIVYLARKGGMSNKSVTYTTT